MRDKYGRFTKGSIPFNKDKKGWTNSGSFKNGHSPSEESIRKMSEAHKGKKISLETRMKMSTAQIGNTCGFKKGLIPWNKGKIFEASRGKKHWNWKGGIYPRSTKTVEYKEWRKSVYERDNYTCLSCGNGNGKLEANHILPWYKYKEVRYETDNGITLCQSCHGQIRKYEEEYAPYFFNMIGGQNL